MASRNRSRLPLACEYSADRFDEDSHHINLLTNVIYDLAANPEYLPPLLKSSIYISHRQYLLLDHIHQMKLLDSLIKANKSTIGSAGPECLAPRLYIAHYHSRPRPVFYHCNQYLLFQNYSAWLHRYALEDITFTDTTLVPKDVRLAVSTHTIKQECIYSNAHTYNRYQFY